MVAPRRTARARSASRQRATRPCRSRYLGWRVHNRMSCQPDLGRESSARRTGAGALDDKKSQVHFPATEFANSCAEPVSMQYRCDSCSCAIVGASIAAPGVHGSPASNRFHWNPPARQPTGQRRRRASHCKYLAVKMANSTRWWVFQYPANTHDKERALFPRASHSMVLLATKCARARTKMTPPNVITTVKSW